MKEWRAIQAESERLFRERCAENPEIEKTAMMISELLQQRANEVIEADQYGIKFTLGFKSDVIRKLNEMGKVR